MPLFREIEADGVFRVYFNRHGAAPLVWCVHNGSVEIAVAEVVIEEGHARTVYQRKETADDDDGMPSAWIETAGHLRISGRVAHIRPSSVMGAR
jgi:hypothetical protein